MINKVTPYSSQPAFCAKVNMDLRCRKYYNECDIFKEVVDIIKNKVQSAEVDIKSDMTSHWSGKRKIYALAESNKGGFNEWELGEIDTKPMGVVSVDSKIPAKSPSIAFYLSDRFDLYKNDNNGLGDKLNLLLYWNEGEK